ncbi:MULTISPECIES: hypothetical protein [Pantoea]|uniref:hypothetical protein n=1 Tax=Pantoea TaxID=53335 RepID=UPI0024B6AD46|nr:hypothetical protein [Pantoea dispersa]MDI9766785.1 hypothetical protein [Pantoea dispersa]
MTTIDAYFPNFVGNAKPNVLVGGIIENMDGSTMYFADKVTIDLEEDEEVTNQQPHLKVPLTFKSAMGLGIAFLAVALGGAWTMYTHLDNKLETYRSGTEARIESARASLDTKIDALGTSTRASIESARVENKSDNAVMTNQLQAISNKLSELNGKLSKDE